MGRKSLFLLMGVVLTAVFALSGWYSQNVSAHGTSIDFTIDTVVNMEARFDDGTPMTQCQYTIFAPNEPDAVWGQGACDENGLFSFAPDPTISGNWAVSVREAGHGEIVNIRIDETGSVAAVSTNAPNNLQNIITGLATVWGFVGTALFFSNRQ